MMGVGCCDDDDDDNDDDDKSWLDESWRLPGSVARQAAATCVSRTNTLFSLTHKYSIASHTQIQVNCHTQIAFHTQIHSCPSYTNTL